LLQLPKGRRLTPTDEVHELAPVDNAPRARPVLRAASFEKTPPPVANDMCRSQHVTAPKGQPKKLIEAVTETRL
jgi:hypothetical protein